MKRNTLIALVAVAGVLLLALGGGYWGYKKMKQQRDHEFRVEATISVNTKFEVEKFKEMIMSERVLDEVIEEKGLVSHWGLSDVGQTRDYVRKRFKASLVGAELKVNYQDKSESTARGVLQSLLDVYQVYLKELAEKGALSK